MRYFIAAVLFALVRAQSDEPLSSDTYIAAVPECVSPGLVADVFVDILKAVTPTNVTVQLVDSSMKTVLAAGSDVVYREDPKTISIRVPSLLPPGNSLLVRVIGSGLEVNFRNETHVSIAYQNVSGFVQTDKAVYKPGDTVQYRIFSLFPDLKVNKAVYNVVIKDPKQNKIRYDMGVTHPTGLIRGNLALSDEPLLGIWTIEISEAGTNTKFGKQFEVQEYVLPRIELVVTPPPFAIVNQSEFEVEVTAKYTFGDYVRGTLEVIASNSYWHPMTKDELQPLLRKRIPDFTGHAVVSFPISSLVFHDRWGTKIKVEGKVTESLTGNTISDTGEFQIQDQAETLEYLSTTPNKFKPGLSYKAFVKVAQQDGSPVLGTLDNVDVDATFSYETKISGEATVSLTPSQPTDLLPNITFEKTPSCSREDVTQLVTMLKVLEGGVLEINIPKIPEHAERLILVVAYKERRAYRQVHRAKPASGYIQARLLNGNPKPGETHILEVKSTVDINTVALMVSSRSRVVLTREVNSPTKSREFSIPLEITHAMGPVADLVAYYRTAKGEIVADVISFIVQDPFETKVSVGFSDDEVQPGDDVTMTVQTAPNSLVATLVSDKKVVLLKTGNDITEREVASTLGDLRCSHFGRRNTVFSHMGLIVLTDGLLDSWRVYRDRFAVESSFYIRGAAGPSTTRRVTADTPLQPVDTLRTEFPDTWLFMVDVTDANGVLSIPTTAPDSITSWQATAFAFNDRSGFGLATEPGELTVAKPFFANLLMPYSIIRGEEVFLQVNVFNNLRINQTVVVELQGSDSYLSLDIDDAGNEILVPGPRTQTLTVPTGIPKSVVFPIKAVEVGDIDITVTARSALASDGLTRKLRVEPEGVPGEYNFMELVNLTATNQFASTREISYPPRVVEDSERLAVNLVGDLLGSTLGNLGNLVRMSDGCGEQNMVNFAPTVFVSQYLDTVGQLTGQRKKDAIRFISEGFQRQMNYKRQDGSYSTFGDRDETGNVWLTAFVLKSFSRAASQDLIPLDSADVKSSYRFITAHQDRNGQFRDYGKLHNKNLRGQTGRGNALTAYILAALVENNLADIDLSNSIALARGYLESYVHNTTDLYEMAISAYALTLARSSQVDAVLKKLELQATHEGGHTYWKVEAESEFKWRPPRSQSKAATIEATSYVCLAYALRRDVSKSAQCLAYLVSQQNDHGGFVSTQDTVVAVQAISAIAPSFYSRVQSGSVTVEAGGATTTFSVNDDTRFVLQQAKLPVSASNVTVTGSGTGLFVLSISARFNVESDLVEPAFTLTAKLTTDTPTAIDLEVCTTYLRGPATSMANIEIRLPSDFTLTPESKDDLLTSVKRVETLNGKVLLYLDEITSNGICLSLSATGNGNINKPKPNSVRVFDYYNPDDSALTFYTLKSLDGGFCEAAVCTSDPEGCSANCSKRRTK